jgi:NADPH-dependent 2,4-dienoyl-CoA reductase/sulfur reductase-like enzyme
VRSSVSARAQATRSIATSPSSGSASVRIELAERAGIATGDGILADERLQTGVPGVFVAGDLAAAQHPFYGERIRVEHWGNALEQGPAAARNMLGGEHAYDRLPYFFSDQYDVGRLIRKRVAVDDRRLADPDIPLDTLAPTEQEAS